jgi:glycosyltransferase involved in cell wall biosynthesis
MTISEPRAASAERPAAGTSGARPTLRLTVAVLTYRRRGDLRAVLPELAGQVAAGSAGADVLVVDNDAAGSGAATVAELVADGAVDGRVVRCVVEARPGIAAARNRALAECADRDVLVFIDDDERPGPAWLAALLRTHAEAGGAGVVGPVVSEFETPLPPWVAAGQFFDRRRLPTGTQVDVAATNNLLLDLHFLRREGITFDERFGISGGSDTLFTRQVVDRGGRLVWCDEAVVADVVPAARTTREWVLRRAFRSGNSWSRTSVALAGTVPGRFAARARCTARGVVRIGGGGGRVVAGALTGSMAQRARGVRSVARGLGMVAGSYGGVYAEYARSDGA